MKAVQSWISEHKLTTIGTLWATAVGASLASSRERILQPSLRLIHARMHAQALTLAVLSGAAVYNYYEKRGFRNAIMEEMADDDNNDFDIWYIN